MRAKYLLLLLPLILHSCAIYKRNFDCPPDMGIPCTSVSDLEQMILETADGPDLFLGIDTEQAQIHENPPSNRIWVPNGSVGYYFYWDKGRLCCKP